MSLSKCSLALKFKNLHKRNSHLQNVIKGITEPLPINCDKTLEIEMVKTYPN
jgi:hypothetical protein